MISFDIRSGNLLCKLLVVCTFSLLVIVKGNTQIINVENLRIITDTTGWAGNAGISFAATRFSRSYAAFSAHGHVQNKSGNNLWLVVMNYDLVSAGGEDFNNRAYGHLRYNRYLGKIMRLELFTQGQFSSVTKVDVRVLSGIGLRLKLSQYERAKFYFGITYMYEYEQLIDPAILNKDHRLSSYLSFSLKPEDGVSFSNTTYVQPRIDFFRDYRISNDTRLNFRISGNLHFRTTFNFLFDAEPPEGIETINYQLLNGLSLSF